MEFLITTKPSFLSDFVNLNRDLQHRFSAAIEELETSPDVPRGDTIKKLKYHQKLWRYRIGDYRLVYAVSPIIILCNCWVWLRVVKFMCV